MAEMILDAMSFGQKSGGQMALLKVNFSHSSPNLAPIPQLMLTLLVLAF
jgi:hypothetical protein